MIATSQHRRRAAALGEEPLLVRIREDYHVGRSHVEPPSRRVCDIGDDYPANRPPLEVGNPAHGNHQNPFGPQ